jgi:hypothetical protein
MYLEYHSVCPLVGIGIGTPHPLSRKRCASPPPQPRGGGGLHSPARERTGESQFGRLERKLSTLSTLCQQVSEIQRSICKWYRKMEAKTEAVLQFTFLWICDDRLLTFLGMVDET